MALGDGWIANDPPTGQGANLGGHCAWILGRRIVEDLAYDEWFCRGVERGMWSTTTTTHRPCGKRLATWSAPPPSSPGPAPGWRHDPIGSLAARDLRCVTAVPCAVTPSLCRQGAAGGREHGAETGSPVTAFRQGETRRSPGTAITGVVAYAVVLAAALLWVATTAPFDCGLEVSQREFGGLGPLTVPHGLLRCQAGGEITFQRNGTTYTLNRVARGSAASDISPLLVNTVAGGTKSLRPLVERGLALCR